MPQQLQRNTGRPSMFQRRKERPKLTCSVSSTGTTLIPTSRLPRVCPVLATDGTS